MLSTVCASSNDAPFVLQYNPLGSLKQATSVLPTSPGPNQRSDAMGQTFANGGQLIRQNQIIQNPNDGTVELELAARHYYGADDRLMAVQRYSWRSPSSSDGTWEEYWYDALGRRILTRARRDMSSIYDASISGPLCMGGIQCRSFTERVWWDGDQSLVEERIAEGTSDVSNNGLVGNIHGLTLDEPLAVITDQTRIVNYNWRGLGKSSVFPNGQAGDNSLGNPATEIDWPAGTQAQTYFTPGPGSGGSGNPKRWMGTFVANGQGTTGMLYRRNRYFNPGSGQFTQADPIGIAGGMNAFGFASGDPINYGDPLGLLDCEKDQPCKNPGAARTIADRMAAAAGDLLLGVLDIFNDIADQFVGTQSAVTAAGLNPKSNDAGARIIAGAGLVAGAGGEAESILTRLTTKQARDLASYVGFGRRVKDAPFDSRGQAVFTNGKRFITQDIDMHLGPEATWKMFNRNGQRLGTYDALLKTRLGN